MGKFDNLSEDQIRGLLKANGVNPDDYGAKSSDFVTSLSFDPADIPGKLPDKTAMSEQEDQSIGLTNALSSAHSGAADAVYGAASLLPRTIKAVGYDAPMALGEAVKRRLMNLIRPSPENQQALDQADQGVHDVGSGAVQGMLAPVTALRSLDAIRRASGRYQDGDRPDVPGAVIRGAADTGMSLLPLLGVAGESAPNEGALRPLAEEEQPPTVSTDLAARLAASEKIAAQRRAEMAEHPAPEEAPIQQPSPAGSPLRFIDQPESPDPLISYPAGGVPPLVPVDESPNFRRVELARQTFPPKPLLLPERPSEPIAVPRQGFGAAPLTQAQRDAIAARNRPVMDEYRRNNPQAPGLDERLKRYEVVGGERRLEHYPKRIPQAIRTGEALPEATKATPPAVDDDAAIPWPATKQQPAPKPAERVSLVKQLAPKQPEASTEAVPMPPAGQARAAVDEAMARAPKAVAAIKSELSLYPNSNVDEIAQAHSTGRKRSFPNELIARAVVERVRAGVASEKSAARRPPASTAESSQRAGPVMNDSGRADPFPESPAQTGPEEKTEPSFESHRRAMQELNQSLNPQDLDWIPY